MVKKSTKGNKKSTKELTIEKGANKLKINTATILGVIWAGLFGYQAFASYMMPEQLFLLVALGLVVGTVLTIAILMYGLKIAEIWAKAGGDGSFLKNTQVMASPPNIVEAEEMTPPDDQPRP